MLSTYVLISIKLGYNSRNENNILPINITLSNVLCAARLPFKRLNPEPKENQLPKRLCEHACPEPGVSDIQDSSALPLHGGPPLVNGRGPLDGFLSRRRPEPSNENMIVDLTTDETLSPTKCLVSPAPASPCLRQKDNQGKSETTTSRKSSNVDHASNLQTSEEVTAVNKDDAVEEIDEEKESSPVASFSELDLTKNSESETEEQDESENVSSLGNKSFVSNSSASSSSECSPEKNDGPTPSTTPNTVCQTILMLFLRVSFINV